jgi:hypothetical protein
MKEEFGELTAIHLAKLLRKAQRSTIFVVDTTLN